MEDITWRACPTGYVFDSNVELASGPGFESTLGQSNFLPPHQIQNGPGSFTPLVQVSQPQPQDINSIELSRRTLAAEFPPSNVP